MRNFGQTRRKGEDKMNWRGAIIRLVGVWVLLEVFRHTLTQFPSISWSEATILAVICAGVGYLVDELFGGYLSPAGRGFVGFIVTTSVLIVYFTHYIAPMVHSTAYVFDAIIIGAIVGLADAVAGRVYSRHRGRQAG